MSIGEYNPKLLNTPVPIMDEARELKLGYGDVPIDTLDPLFNEPLVAIDSLGIAGRAYYSSPNPATGEAVDGVDPRPYLRESIALTLQTLNQALATNDTSTFFGAPVELYVQEGLRSVELQKYLYDDVFPQRIRQQFDEANITVLSESVILARRDQLIAKPSADPAHPSPHATGAAFDIELRYKNGETIHMGHVDGDTGPKANPDFFEKNLAPTIEKRTARRNRRAFYAIMTGAAFGIDTGFQNNPTEWWHWGRGDQLSARLAKLAFASYSLAPPVDQLPSDSK